MVDGLLAFIAPHSCSGCGNMGSILCPSCKNDIVYEPFSGCLGCLRPTLDANLCAACRKQMWVESGWVVGVREGALRNLIDRYKFDSAKEAGRVCVELLHQRLPVLPPGVVVVPVPTSPAHRRARGFDHTWYIAKAFAARRKLSCLQTLSRHSNDTQHFRSRSQRLKQAALGLETVREVPADILLIDDIYTTGATLRACVQKLRAAGAKRIFVAIIARQTLDETSDLW